ncbi:hypothetical protein SNE25_30180 [Mucilaginibacter sabulilitoris]|uniref:Inosine/uridine-preferring nucleoside hydrolase domain-containing protein n=1 Tax=Mucilaginibacter sabulilitoris TaxID=1173583 RepID=A0ABZ0TPD0_9SPHI|nr:hypothetical protein [Mucilaginibacter sabulilitoris]WPU93589.1 hypothetical protein SNE25_30180 [Mucilaginibacter sabulilitoris]
MRSTIMRRRLLFSKLLCLAIIVIICGFVNFNGTTATKRNNLLPYDHTNPIMYDNDYANDEVDWYLMATASLGAIKYQGITTTSAVAPFVPGLAINTFKKCVSDRTRIVEIGRRSGFRHIPEAVAGPIGNLEEPASGKIEDTKPLNSPGTQAVLEAARKATSSKPLVICMGGPLTIAVDAYLLDQSIADKMVLAWTGGRYDSMSDYNGWVDPWAAYIALSRLRLVQFPVDPLLFPGVSKSWIRENFPDNEAKQFLVPLKLDVVNGDDRDGDGMPAVSVTTPGYVTAVKHVSFAGWKIYNGHKLPGIKDDPGGRAIVVIKANSELARSAYKKVFLNPAAWNNKSK